MKSAKEEIEKAKKDELFEYTIDIIQENFYDEMMTNLNKVEDPDRYFNQYYGYTKIGNPYFDKGSRQLSYYVETIAANSKRQHINTIFWK